MTDPSSDRSLIHLTHIRCSRSAFHTTDSEGNTIPARYSHAVTERTTDLSNATFFVRVFHGNQSTLLLLAAARKANVQICMLL